MICRSLLTRSSPVRWPTMLATRLCSRSLSTLRLVQPPWRPAPSCTISRRFSVAPAFPAEDQDNTEASPLPSGTCYIANIPFNVTAKELEDALSEFGKVVSVRLLTTNNGLSRGVCFVRFESVADAVSFVETNTADPIFILDRRISVKHAKAMNAPNPAEPSRTLMIPDFRGESEVELRTMFGSSAGNIGTVRFTGNKAEQRIQAFIQFRNTDLATEAMDAFKSQNENTRIIYVREKKRQADTNTLVSRLSQAR